MNHLNTLSPSGIHQYLNLAAFVPETRVLGPGNRVGIWVQGCVFHCPGCISPDWIPLRENQLVKVSDLVNHLRSLSFTGITISGGEPFLQAALLARLLAELRQDREFDCIVFSGFTVSALQTLPGAAELLAQIDLLIDGGYVAARDFGIGLRGSENQQFHFLSPRLSQNEFPFETFNRVQELHFQGDNLLVVGIPGQGFLPAFNEAIRKAEIHALTTDTAQISGAEK